MRPRQSITELFSTFLQFHQDRVQNWASDPRLRRSMERCQAQGTPAQPSENYWALYWHKRLFVGSNPQPTLAREHLAWEHLAREHLVAYVQEPCYWVAHKTTANFSHLPYSLSDCFQMAIAQVDKVLRGFDAQQGFSLKNYASATLGSLIREQLRQRQEVDICTDWALLRKLSQKRLTAALLQAGLSTETIDAYILAWNSFKTLYMPQQASGTRQLNRPDRATWEAIVQLYNAERLTQLTPASPIATPDMLEKWLLASAKAARAYLYPTMVSINTPKPGQETGEFLDDLAETSQTDSLLSDLIHEEEHQTRQQQHQQLSLMLTTALSQLDEPSQALIQFYYRDGLTQQQMAERLDMKQYTVSRRLTKAREKLLLAVAQWSQETLHITPNSDLLRSAIQSSSLKQ